VALGAAVIGRRPLLVGLTALPAVGGVAAARNGRRGDGMLASHVLETPFGPLAYALPEGYCALPDSDDGRRLAMALDRLVPPPREARRARFLPCTDLRRTFEERRWPLVHGIVQAEAFRPSRPGLEGTLEVRLERTHRGLIRALAESPLARAILLHLLVPGLPIGPVVNWVAEEMIGDLRPAVRTRWAAYLEVVRERARRPGFRREGFVLGRDAYAVWWGGVERGGEGRVLAVVLATTFVGDIGLTMGLSRPFAGGPAGERIYDDMRGDLLPAVALSLALNGVPPPGVPRR
jgi:hypothetical protein